MQKTRNAVPAARTCTACSRPDSLKDSRKTMETTGNPVAAVFQFRVQLRFLREPVVGFEPTTCCLRNSCSTAELHRLLEPTPGLEPGTSILPRLCSAS